MHFCMIICPKKKEEEKMLNVLLFIAVNWKVLRDFMHDREVYAYIQYKKELKCMYITYIYISFVYIWQQHGIYIPFNPQKTSSLNPIYLFIQKPF